MQVVDVVVVWHGDVTASRPVLMFMGLVHRVTGHDALVNVIFVDPMDVAVVEVVDMVVVRERHMPAALAVNMRVVGVRDVFRRSSHCLSPGHSVICARFKLV
ncbi:hypothetical protein ACQP1W_29430 [Spirillospora sp. CA-255316]